MNSLNDEVCSYNSEPVTENFRTCEEAGGQIMSYWKCHSLCGRNNGRGWECINP